MFSKLKISHKGLLLVSLPLVFELAFVLTLSHLQHESDKIATHERRLATLSAEVNATANALSQSCVAVAAYLSINDMSSGEHIEELLAKSNEQLQKVDACMVDFPGIRHDYAAYNEATKEVISTVRQLKYAKTVDLVTRVSAMFKVRRALHRLNLICAPFLQAIKQEQLKDPALESESRRLLDACLASGIAINLALTVVLAVFFSRNITRRVRIIQNNAHRLASSQRLLAPQPGSDEIADLDTIFHEMAASLEDAATRERALVDEALDVILSLDAQLHVVRMNHAGCALWSDESIVLGKRIVDLLHPEDSSAAIAVFEKMRYSDHPAAIIESRVISHENATLYMLWSVRWSKSNQSFFCIGRDVTQARELEMLKRDFLSMVSHDLRTPLTSVASFLQVLSAGVYGELSDAGIRSTDKVQSNLSRLINMINNLLDMEKMERGKMTLIRKPVSLSNIVSDSIDLVEDVAKLRNLTIVFEEQEELIVNADHERLVQVVQNLLSNAIKFSPPSSVITVTITKEGSCAKVQITDQGPGITRENCAVIFDRFKQVKDSAKEGFGLGLAICKAVIEEHEGQIGVSSEVGVGSSFWFTLEAQQQRSALTAPLDIQVPL